MAAIDKTYIKSYQQYREIADWCKAQGTVTDSFGNVFTPYNYIPHMWEYDEEYNSTDLGEYTEEYINNWLNGIREHDAQFKTEEHWKKHLELYSDVPRYLESISTFEKYCKKIDDNAEIPLWNTDHVFDIYLIKNCPIDFIQERLKVQYGGGWSKEAFTENSNSYEAIKNGTSAYDTYKRNGIKKPHFNVNYKVNKQLKDDDLEWFINIKDIHWNYDSAADYWYHYNECYVPKSNSWSSINDNIKGNITSKRLKRILNKWNLPKGITIEFTGYFQRYTMKKFSVKIK